MTAFIEKLDSKTVAQIITSAGGILLAAMFGWLYFQTVNNHLSNMETVLGNGVEVQRQLTGAIQANTAVLQTFKIGRIQINSN